MKQKLALGLFVLVAASLLLANTQAFAETREEKIKRMNDATEAKAKQMAAATKALKQKQTQVVVKSDIERQLDALYKQGSALAKSRVNMTNSEYMTKYNQIQDQIEILENQKNGNVQSPPVQANDCAIGRVMDSFGNCVTPEQKKATPVKTQKGINAETSDEVAKLKLKIADLELKVSQLESVINQLKAYLGIN